MKEFNELQLIYLQESLEYTLREWEKFFYEANLLRKSILRAAQIKQTQDNTEYLLNAHDHIKSEFNKLYDAIQNRLIEINK
jgi:hypothetical protein